MTDQSASSIVKARQVARQLIGAVSWDCEATASRWRSVTAGPDGVDWSEFLVLALQHRVAGLACDALDVLGWSRAMPFTMRNDLIRRGAADEARQEMLSRAWQELAGEAGDLMGEVVVLKGAALMDWYESPRHRRMSDFDLLVSQEVLEALRPHLEGLGYVLRDSLNGPTCWKHVPGRIGKLTIDIHVANPIKYNRERLVEDLYLKEVEAHSIRGIDCKRPCSELLVVNVLTHAHEHAASWFHAVFDDDIRLIRLIDVELICHRVPVDASHVWRQAAAMNVHGELALGLWQVLELRGRLPAPLEPLRPAAEAVAHLGDLMALPGGEVRRWDLPFADRAFRTDRTLLALAHVEPELRDFERIYDFENAGTLLPKERVADIAADARAVLAETSLT